MRVDGPNRTQGAASGASVKRTGSGATFQLPTEETTTSATQKTAAVRATPGLEALLALQEVDEQAEKRKRGLKRGHKLLDSLDALKVAVLEGQVSPAVLHNLSDALGEASEATDNPGLNEVLDAIDLRAQVELAKLQARNV